jgi:hypothetical protein
MSDPVVTHAGGHGMKITQYGGRVRAIADANPTDRAHPDDGQRLARATEVSA